MSESAKPRDPLTPVPPLVAPASPSLAPPPRPHRTAVDLLRSASADDYESATAALEQFLSAFKADLESLNGRDLVIDDLERYVTTCRDVVPELRRFFRHWVAARPFEAELVAEATHNVQNAFGLVRAALQRFEADATASDLGRLAAIADAIDETLEALRHPSPAGQPECAPAASARHPARAGRRRGVLIALALLGLVAALALVAAVVS